MIDKLVIRAFRSTLVKSDKVLSPDDPAYVPNLHGSDNEDVIAALQEDLLTQPEKGTSLFYFSGQRGTGKSTELRRLEVMLNAEAVQVVRFDSLDYLFETDPINQETLSLLVASGLADWAAAHYHEDFKTSSAWRRFSAWLQTDIELTEVSYGGIKAKLKDQSANIAEKLAKLSAGSESHKAIAAFSAEIVEFLRNAAHRNRVVVIVDSLEQLRGVGADQGLAFTRVVQCFAGNFHRLHVPGAAVVYSVPPYLALLEDVANFVRLHTLASVRVFEPPQVTARQPRPTGLQAMRSLIHRRHARAKDLFTDAALDRLALASGGDLRHYMLRLVSDAAYGATFALERLPLQADDAIINTVIGKSRVETEQLTRLNEWPLLKNITTTHKAMAEDMDNSLHMLARLFQTRVILNYRNGQEWFDIHPLLWESIDAYNPTPELSGAAPAASV